MVASSIVIGAFTALSFLSAGQSIMDGQSFMDHESEVYRKAIVVGGPLMGPSMSGFSTAAVGAIFTNILFWGGMLAMLIGALKNRDDQRSAFQFEVIRIRCPECRALNEDNAVYCKACGKTL